ncbi:MAG: VWA domain-containing protein [Oligoflexales bacterium]
MNVLRSFPVAVGIASLALAGIAAAKPVKNKYGVTKNGKMPEPVRQELTRDVEKTKANMSQEHYEDIVKDPQLAKNDQEKIAGLSAREVFILVDRSGSMNAEDENPTGQSMGQQWTRWDSARVAAESISELSLSLDQDGKVDIMLWDGDRYSNLQHQYESMTNVSDIKYFFENNRPERGSTPLAEALEEVYSKHLAQLLRKSEPFTCIILTDGQPNDPSKVKNLFKRIITENNLEQPGRETLAAFSFVRMGDDQGAISFLKDLDDNLISQLGVNVDIVDTKEDNFLFGTGMYSGREGIGPFALFWDALYD